MVLIGLAAAAVGTGYKVGTLTQMGPGFFPVALGAMMIILGLLIGGNARRCQAPAGVPLEHATGADSAPEWRGWLCILAGIGSFAVLGPYVGLLPATFTTVFVSALGDRGNTWRNALVLAALMTVVAYVVFWWALQLQIPLYGGR
ncbi:MAG: tripartite tricarboxylate transporter TctB family protein [Janthinobacterium lividum]